MTPKFGARHAHAGRYAPSPTGELHKGSLLAALASFLQAKAHGAPWYMRIDDLDTPRMVSGAASRILRTLEAFGLCWDGPVLYQSQRHSAYVEALARLRAQGRLFDCGCTRREAQTGPPGLDGPIYPGTCRAGLPAGREPRSMRVVVDDKPVVIADRIQGRYQQNLATDIGDFVVRRADGIVAYQLATVVDDAAQGVAEVVRGADLLSSTPRQLFLGRALGYAEHSYAHVPLLVDEQGQKLGKSNGSLALNARRRGDELVAALSSLGQGPLPELAVEPIERIIEWAIEHWSVAAVPAQRCIGVGVWKGA